MGSGSWKNACISWRVVLKFRYPAREIVIRKRGFLCRICGEDEGVKEKTGNYYLKLKRDDVDAKTNYVAFQDYPVPRKEIRLPGDCPDAGCQNSGAGIRCDAFMADRCGDRGESLGLSADSVYRHVVCPGRDPGAAPFLRCQGLICLGKKHAGRNHT